MIQPHRYLFVELPLFVVCQVPFRTGLEKHPLHDPLSREQPLSRGKDTHCACAQHISGINGTPQNLPRMLYPFSTAHVLVDAIPSLEELSSNAFLGGRISRSCTHALPPQFINH